MNLREWWRNVETRGYRMSWEESHPDNPRTPLGWVGIPIAVFAIVFGYSLWLAIAYGGAWLVNLI